jgi:hypothetical protein
MALAGLNPAGIFSYGEVVGNLKGQLSTLQTQVNVLSGFGNLIQGLANFDEQLQARIPSWRETSMTSPEPKPPKIVPRIDRRDIWFLFPRCMSGDDPPRITRRMEPLHPTDGVPSQR